MGNCCHSRCCWKTRVSSPVLSRMITPMLGAHSTECVNWVGASNSMIYKDKVIAKLSGSRIRSWVALSFLVGCSFVRPSGSVTSPLISTVWCFRPYKPYMMHVWWYLVVSGPCLMVSGGVWSMSGGVWSLSGDVNGYRLIWPDLMYMGRYLFQCL